VSDFPITSGRFWAAVAAFRAVMGSETTSEQELTHNLVRLGESISPAMTLDGIELLNLCRLIDRQNSSITAGDRAGSVWSEAGSNDRQSVAKRLLFQVIRGPRRDLSVIAFMEPEVIRAQHPEIFELIRDTGLLGEQSSESSQFWSKLRSVGSYSPSPESAEGKARRGLEAEELSLKFEARRLRAEGYMELAKSVSHVASNTLLGFDILSFTGEPDMPSAALEIEVKNLSFYSDGKAYFHVTRSEAARAETSPNRYVFHLWNTLGDMPLCYVAPSSQILEHLPRETSSHGKWESCIINWSELEGSD
jgi:hypothetical protein